MTLADLHATNYDPRDPNPWLALALDQSLPIDPEAKGALLRGSSSWSRRWMFNVIRPFVFTFFLLVKFVRALSPHHPNLNGFLHKTIHWGLRSFASPDANLLIMRHFHVGTELLAFIKANAGEVEVNTVPLRPPIAYDRVPETVTAYDVALTIVPESPPDWQYQPTIKGVEYRALGMPVIATDLPPNRELVSHEVNGLLVSNTADSIAAALLRFISDPAFRTRCRANAQAMRDGPTWDAAATQYMDIYRRLLAPDGPGEAGRAESGVEVSVDSAR